MWLLFSDKGIWMSSHFMFWFWLSFIFLTQLRWSCFCICHGSKRLLILEHKDRKGVVWLCIVVGGSCIKFVLRREAIKQVSTKFHVSEIYLITLMWCYYNVAWQDTGWFHLTDSRFSYSKVMCPNITCIMELQINYESVLQFEYII